MEGPIEVAKGTRVNSIEVDGSRPDRPGSRSSRGPAKRAVEAKPTSVSMRLKTLGGVVGLATG